MKEQVVTESSACIDGQKRVSLDADHLRLNKFQNRDDPSFKAVCQEIMEMVGNAPAVVNARLNGNSSSTSCSLF
jgi:hypothetical protein